MPGLLAQAGRGYAAGIRAVTKVAWTFPDKPDERRALVDLISLHAPGLRGEKLEAKLTALSSSYCEATKDRARFEGGFRPSKCLEWLNAGGADARANSEARAGPDARTVATNERQMAEIYAGRRYVADKAARTKATENGAEHERDPDPDEAREAEEET